MKLNTIYGKKTVISFEIFPPKHGAALQNIDETLEILCSLKPAFISVTFGAGGSTVNSKTVEIAKKIKEVYRVEPKKIRIDGSMLKQIVRFGLPAGAG